MACAKRRVLKQWQQGHADRQRFGTARSRVYRALSIYSAALERAPTWLGSLKKSLASLAVNDRLKSARYSVTPATHTRASPVVRARAKHTSDEASPASGSTQGLGSCHHPPRVHGAAIRSVAVSTR